MFSAVLAGPRVTVHLIRRLFASVLEAAETVPRIATALDEVRATLRHLERLLSYVAEELPELTDQLDRIRARVDGPRDRADVWDERRDRPQAPPAAQPKRRHKGDPARDGEAGAIKRSW
ncbi:hypothetical protein [Amycolatopsis sp. A1MSW2902]|uniref:hypothetical protein n=1 Tax=Amycolatopsis sp. A1MSW2902 TaxID=687413 RepID=UPI00307DE7E2